MASTEVTLNVVAMLCGTKSVAGHFVYMKGMANLEAVYVGGGKFPYICWKQRVELVRSSVRLQME